ncbi:hypothetical protein [Jejuia pallidilutea]|uniref:Uncharacterized protein n=1 Tax=Jejuia pallidilutea TaxID=504487 RepID=A0A090X0J9_9FLAO|nr:hypothetical protein [Jejuia pallidilutea]GAL73157.1 hypothetical protein JCM19302_3038 [Jejuia pallidilutea]
MSNFLLDNYHLITYSLEFLAAVTGLFFYKKYKNTAAKYFIYFLWFIAISDTLCYYTQYVKPDRFLSFLIGTKFEKNHWWSNLYWVIGAIMFFSFYYRKILKTELHKRMIKVASYGFFAFSLIYIALIGMLFLINSFLF